MALMPSVSDDRAGTPRSPDGFSGQQLLVDCGICGGRFASKKALRVHINTHLRKPCIVLKRVTGPKVVKRKQSEYWLDPEKKGSLKLTLKKQGVKLTIKKNSEAFTVVNRNFYPDIGNCQEEEVAGATENDHRDDRAAESLLNEQFENVMVDQQVGVYFFVTDVLSADTAWLYLLQLIFAG